jgi:drug/metabolite transporter (DMT)-like permease
VYILLALLTSVLYGGADFLGAIASRRAAVLVVSGVSQAAGLIAMAVAVALLPRAHPVPADFLWGAATGVAGAFSLGFLFSAFAIGRIGVVAPIAAAVGAAIPVLVGVALGERLGLSVWVGIALAVAAIVLIGWEPNPLPVAGDAPAGGAPRLDRSVVLALAAGLAIGAFYSCLQRATAGSGLWPLLVARAVSCPALFLAARVRRQAFGSLRGVVLIVVGSGLLDIVANICYFVAVHHGPLSVIATLASLYPAASVLLAYIILREHLHRRQLAGLAVGTAAIALISSGAG